ncbi:hypothetical protein C6989_04915 [Nitrosopumilus sp. b2]|nr:hypothetical protein C6989_04915 [Nitrosopumilus sp. b2]
MKFWSWNKIAGYLGDTNLKIVHHLACKQKECNIYNVEKKNRQYFSPDTLEVANSLGFSPCKHCI